MSRPKNPFPTHATPEFNQVAEVQGMQVHRRSAPNWTDYLVQDPWDKDVRVSVHLRRTSEAWQREFASPHARWLAEAFRTMALRSGEYSVERVEEKQENTRAHAEAWAVRRVVSLAKATLFQMIVRGSPEERLLGLDAPRTVQRAKNVRRRLERGEP